MENPARGLVLLDPQMIVDGDLMQENKDLTKLENFKKEWEERRKVVLKAFAYLNLIHLFKKMSLAFLKPFAWFTNETIGLMFTLANQYK